MYVGENTDNTAIAALLNSQNFRNGILDFKKSIVCNTEFSDDWLLSALSNQAIPWTNFAFQVSFFVNQMDLTIIKIYPLQYSQMRFLQC